MKDLDNFISQTKDKLIKAIEHLEYSFEKIQSLPSQENQLDNESLETWESFCARFARVADIFMMRYLKAKVKQGDPGFDGSLRDYLNQAEKMGLIDDVSAWLSIRELRNRTAHDYTSDSLSTLLGSVKKNAPILMAVKKIL